MAEQQPTEDQIKELVDYLPILDGEGFVPVKRWLTDVGGSGAPYPDYADEVVEFFKAASGSCWHDPHYGETAGRLLVDPSRIDDASLAELRAVLTSCVRGERFSDGYWATMIESGIVRRILERLQELQDDSDRRQAFG